MEQKLSTDVDVVYAWSHLCLPMFPGSILTCVVKTSAQIPFSAANAGQLSALKDKGKRGHQWQGIVIGGHWSGSEMDSSLPLCGSCFERGLTIDPLAK